MSFRGSYDELIKLLVTEDRADDIRFAKEEFWKLTGKFHGGESFYEDRLSAFFDWYIFDRLVSGRTYIANFLIKEPLIEREKVEIYREFINNIHSIFEVKWVSSVEMNVKDLFTGKKYLLQMENSIGFDKGSFFEGRILPYKGDLFLSPAVCFHPREVGTKIRHILRTIRKEGRTDILPFIHRLAHMNLKVKTSRYIKIKDIYSFPEYGKERFWWKWF